VSGDIGSIETIKLTPGVYVNLSYELKIISYSVETTHAATIAAKAAWKAAEELYK
jgi:hypothetical protein